METTKKKFDLDQLTLGEVAAIEDLSGVAIGSVSESTPQGKFLAALYMVAKRRDGQPTFTFNAALQASMSEAQSFLGFDAPDAGDEADEAESSAEGKRRQLARERARLKAQFIVQLGMDPAAYERLTIAERDAIVRELNKRNSRRR
ncbi:tail assembly chaperone [Microbacterium phage Sippinontea]|uniref:Tail assembly chaperone n=1 Tax=Microbacterium phage Quaker TaxID=2250352 RepID=A0A2Z5H8W1_9CAUD|nr:tail assembly chaperone [Microbacterium phage Quaker]AXC35369.1 tail assembly chaperone [Microbacterium phage KayPaulus]QDF18038.1 tail assembly chaperone [Microbacterium phage Belthelas]QKY78777.1 tail assembly chaperone [Microbacterium phage Livingwater]QOI67287.1 tail assembly chaperone [Microbacterium phage Sippinontea]QRI45131.1 tail assembly chaperone [Microbacterium phage Wolfpack]QXN74894.1 tail assembly chaperone [Microbacterium phage BoomRoasted]UYL85388.1 tail assembly chaperon